MDVFTVTCDLTVTMKISPTNRHGNTLRHRANVMENGEKEGVVVVMVVQQRLNPISMWLKALCSAAALIS